MIFCHYVEAETGGDCTGSGETLDAALADCVLVAYQLDFNDAPTHKNCTFHEGRAEKVVLKRKKQTTFVETLEWK